MPEAHRRLLITAIVISFGSVVVALLLPFPATKYALTGVLGILILVTVARAPEITLVILIFFLPAVDLFPPDLTPVPGLNAQTGVMGLAILGSTMLASRRPGRIPLAGLFLALLVVTAVSTLKSLVSSGRDPLTLITMTKNWLGYLPLFFLAARAGSRTWGRKVIVGVLMASAVLVCLDSTLQYLAGSRSATERSSGQIGGQPNIYGGYLAMILPLFVSLSLSRLGSKTVRIFLLSGTALCGLALVFTKSRGAWIALAAALACIVILRRNFGLLALIVVLAVFSTAILPEEFFDRIDETFSDQPSPMGEAGFDASTEARLTQWKSFPTLMMVSPIIGNGIWTYNSLIYKKGLYYRPISPHSSIIRFGVEFGLAGLVIYFSIMVALILRSNRLAADSPDPFDRALYAGLLGAFVALLIADVSGARFFNDEVFAIFCCLAGLVGGGLFEARTASRSAGP